MNLPGAIAELRFIEWLVRRGNEVMVPHFCSMGSADVAWRNPKAGEHHWVTGQIKKAYVKAGAKVPSVNMTRAGDVRYHVSDSDFLAAIDYDKDQMWLIPFHRVCDVARLTLTEKWEDYRHGL